MPVCIGKTPVYTEKHEFQHFHINRTHSAHSKTTQEETFPGPSQLQKLNQFKPVLASGKILKNLKFLPFCTNFTHFYFKFLKDIYIFRIHGPSGSLWYPLIQDSSSISRDKYFLPPEVTVQESINTSEFWLSIIIWLKI